MRSARRSLLEFLRYSAILECRRCDLRGFEERRLATFLSRFCRCPKCGGRRIRKLSRRDPVEDMYANPLSLVQALAGAKLCYCSLCRLQFYDFRPLRCD